MLPLNLLVGTPLVSILYSYVTSFLSCCIQKILRKTLTFLFNLEVEVTEIQTRPRILGADPMI